MNTMLTIAERLDQVKNNIAAACDRVGRSLDEVKLIVVTKNAPLESVKEVIKLGFHDLGEGRIMIIIIITFFAVRVDWNPFDYVSVIVFDFFC